ncbi:MAG: outer membrane lipoprotein-sorting protein [Candidatus Cloacimonetes bacterium]|nr:outer membrane lipoprotein-sorting protein [Candidatus Cloacimonadota bacterium]
MKTRINGMIVIFVMLLLFIGSVEAQELTINEILKLEDENSPNSEITISEMTIFHKSGSKRVRTIKVWMKGEDSTFVRFISPANIKGASFLSVNDNDWLYLPALKKVRRIATKDKGGSFMGSDFSYDDIGGYSWEEDFNSELSGSEKYNEHDCYILELTPKNPKDISYSRIKRWIDKEHFYSLKTEYYDIHGDLLKVLYSSEFEKIEGFWISRKMEMQNVQKGSKTVIEIKETELNPDIPDKMFTTRQLEKK